ncbi:hypothetical protein JM18_008921 [Phytophthora kernoviae]|uniref:RxLR effector protein n=1 Tax=Phytophthora kernoviae TaxID=325452 RepID=A0A921SAD2_9STRA|nr:hypothetical protein JM18_008921 [Phytophthora kernoviae]
MHHLRSILVVVIAFLARSDTLSVAIESGHTKSLTINDSLSGHSLASIRGSVKVANTDDDDDDDNDDFIDTVDPAQSESEDRGGLIGFSETKAFLKREYNNIAPRIMAKTNKNADDTADAIWKYFDDIKLKLGKPVYTTLTEADAFRHSAKGQLFHEFFDEFMGKQVKTWVKDGKTSEFVKTELRMDKLSAEAMKSSPHFKYYDKFMSKTTNEWARDDKSIDDVKKALGMEKLSVDAIKTSANYKYYDEFMGSIVNRWVGGGKSIDDVKKLLGMDTLSTAAFKLNSNFKYYDKFMTHQVGGWLRSGKTTDVVKKLLGLDTLSADAMKLSPNVKYYDQFLQHRINSIVARANYVPPPLVTYDVYMSNSVKSWVKSGKTSAFVKKELGLDKLPGEALRNHINHGMQRPELSGTLDSTPKAINLLEPVLIDDDDGY